MIRRLPFFEQAIDVATDDNDRADLHERAGASANQAGRYEDAERNLLAALETHRGNADAAGIVRATTLLGRAATNAGRPGDAVALLDAGRQGGGSEPDPGLAWLDSELARALFLNEEAERSIAVSDRALKVAEHLGLISIVADTLVTKGTVLSEVGRWHEGLSLIEGGRQLAEANGLVWTEVRAHTNASSGLVVRDPKRALDLAGRGIAIARRVGLRTSFSSLFVNFGSAARRTGDWDRAIQELETVDLDKLEPADRAAVALPVMLLKAARGSDVAAELAGIDVDLATIPDQQAASMSAMARAFVLSVAGRHREASDECFSSAGASNVLRLWALPLAGRYAVLDRDPARALDAARELEAMSSPGPALAADIETIRAGSAALEGALPEATEGYRRAMNMWRDLGLVWDEALCAIDMATLLNPMEPAVRVAADSAREILTRLGAKPFLDRLEVAMQRQLSPVRSQRASTGPGERVTAAGTSA
jgi:tetratricopeptide (TPR) repeat protein